MPTWLSAPFAATVGVGYQLAIVKDSACETAAVTRVVQAHSAGARLHGNVSAELCYVLPADSKSQFGQLFAELDRSGSTLGIVSYGASVTTMDEVFIR